MDEAGAGSVSLFFMGWVLKASLVREYTLFPLISKCGVQKFLILKLIEKRGLRISVVSLLPFCGFMFVTATVYLS